MLALKSHTGWPGLSYPRRAAQRRMLLALVGLPGLLSFFSRRWALRFTLRSLRPQGKPNPECPESNRKCPPRQRGGAGCSRGKRGPRGLGGAWPARPRDVWRGSAGLETPRPLPLHPHAAGGVSICLRICFYVIMEYPKHAEVETAEQAHISACRFTHGPIRLPTPPPTGAFQS